MSSFKVSTEKSQGIYGGVGKICPALPQIGLTEIACLCENTARPCWTLLSVQKIKNVSQNSES